MTIEQVLFVNNTSTYRALYVFDAENVCIEKSDFFSNNGAIHIESSQTDSRFTSNTATLGGAVFVASANVTIS